MVSRLSNWYPIIWLPWPQVFCPLSALICYFDFQCVQSCSFVHKINATDRLLLVVSYTKDTCADIVSALCTNASVTSQRYEKILFSGVKKNATKTPIKFLLKFHAFDGYDSISSRKYIITSQQKRRISFTRNDWLLLVDKVTSLVDRNYAPLVDRPGFPNSLSAILK